MICAEVPQARGVTILRRYLWIPPIFGKACVELFRAKFRLSGGLLKGLCKSLPGMTAAWGESAENTETGEAPGIDGGGRALENRVFGTFERQSDAVAVKTLDYFNAPRRCMINKACQCGAACVRASKDPRGGQSLPVLNPPADCLL